MIFRQVHAINTSTKVQFSQTVCMQVQWATVPFTFEQTTTVLVCPDVSTPKPTLARSGHAHFRASRSTLPTRPNRIATDAFRRNTKESLGFPANGSLLVEIANFDPALHSQVEVKA
mmetsp:Transcript_1629/g.10047  ORF Transcript_1629/g.10047 Transcript_1629/m.10047 type:complete len:116 (-) Transcript_1629:779-1126(-)